MKKRLKRRMDEAAYRLALAVEDVGVPVEAAFWRLEEDERWFLYLASPGVDEQGVAAVMSTVRERFLSTGYGKGVFTLNDVRAIGLDDVRFHAVRFDHDAPRGGGIHFTPGLLLLWARRVSAEPILVLPIEVEDPSDAGCEFAIVPLTPATTRIQVVPPNDHRIFQILPPGRSLVWKGDLRLPELEEGFASGEGPIRAPEPGGPVLTFEGERGLVDWGKGRGFVPREPVVAALTACGQAYRAARRRLALREG